MPCSHFGHELRLLPAVKQCGADACVLRLSDLDARPPRALPGRAPFARRHPAGFGCHNSKSVRPSSICHSQTTLLLPVRFSTAALVAVGTLRKTHFAA